MQSCLDKITKAPLNYFNQIRQLKVNSVSMKGTSFYPSFLMSLIASFLCIIGLSAYLIFYFFTKEYIVCFDKIGFGVIALAILYPLQAILIFICLLGSAAISESKAWKLIVIAFFGIMVTGFPFGGLGFAFLCTISEVHPLLIKASFLSSNTFIQIVVYFYISFAVLYLIMVPLLTYLFNQRKQNPDPEGECMDNFCCIVHYFFQFLFVLTAVFMLVMKIIGVPLLIYVLIEITRSGMNSSAGNLSPFYALVILSFCLPFFTFSVVYLLKKFVFKQVETPYNTPTERQSTIATQKVQVTQETGRKTIFFPNKEPKEFSDENTLQINNEENVSSIKNNML